MKKRIIILFAVVLFLTGCKATVNIDIDKNKVTESIEVVGSDVAEYSKIKNWSGFPLETDYDDYMDNYLLNDTEKRQGVRYYDVINDDNSFKTNVSSSFNFSSYQNSSIVNNCFKYFNVIEEDNIVTFSTSKGLRCEFYDYDIIVKTPYNVVSNNAHKVDSVTNTYTWSVNRNNVSDFGIYLEIDLSKNSNGELIKDNNDNNKETSSLNKAFSPFIVIAVIIISIFGILVLVKILKKKKDSLDI